MDKLHKKLSAYAAEEEEGRETPTLNLKGYVYAWGKNKDGELSVGNNKNCLAPTPVRNVKDKMVAYIASGGQHSSMITSDGLMTIVGSSLHNKLGLEDLHLTYINSFQIVPFLQNHVVKQVACGEFHTLCLLDSGVVYTWGGTLHKKLGQTSNKPGPIPVLMDKKIISVGCGDFHSVALTEKGDLYAWGGGGSHYNKGQLGHGHLNDVEQPELIKFFKGKPVQKFSCGGYHTMALLTTGELYGWGSGGYGECGFGEFVDSPTPRKVVINTNQRYYQEVLDELMDNDGDITPYVLEISCGGHHSMILTDKGLFTCGYASHGQLGLKGTVNQADPQFVYTLSNKKIIQIAAGWNHSLVLTDTLDLYVSGHGLFGQLGLGTEESKTGFTHLTLLRGKNIRNIFAGGNHSWVILDYENPINPDYTPPSPIRSYPNTPITGKSRDVSPLNGSRIRLGPNEEESAMLKHEKMVQIVYTDNEMSHRFIRFVVPEIADEAFQVRLEEFIKDMYSFEVGIQFHKLQLDTEVIEEVNGFGKLISPTTKKNSKAYTLMFVCDLRKNNLETNPFSKRNVPNSQVMSTIIGEMHLVKESDIRKDEMQRLLCHWMVAFIGRFSDVVSSMKFFELRPAAYA